MAKVDPATVALMVPATAVPAPGTNWIRLLHQRPAEHVAAAVAAMGGGRGALDGDAVGDCDRGHHRQLDGGRGWRASEAGWGGPGGRRGPVAALIATSARSRLRTKSMR